MRREWRVGGLADAILLVQRFNNRPHEQAVPLSPLEASSWVDSWFPDDLRSRHLLLDICDALGNMSSAQALGATAQWKVKVRRALEDGALVAYRIRSVQTAAGILRPDAEVPRPSPKNAPTTDLPTRSFYEIIVLDERDVPIVGVKIVVSTPLSTATHITDGSGRVRVSDAAPGFGSARIEDKIDLAKAMQGHENRPRRSRPLPEGEGWHIRLPTRLHEPIILPDGEPQRLMIVTRTDIVYAFQSADWENLYVAKDAVPAHLRQDKQTHHLALHANALDAVAIVYEKVAETKPITPSRVAPPPSATSPWAPPDLYTVQPGDNLSLLAKRYFRDASRWKEIWDLNRANYPGRSPDLLFPGDVLRMPAEAVPSWVSLPLASPPPEDYEPPPSRSPPVWIEAPIDTVHQALFDGHMGTVFQWLEGLLRSPEPVPARPPPPFLEELWFRANMAALVLEGWVDPTEPSNERVEDVKIA
ncbi:LysM peptidoglycan-binding domain-containing protein [Sorangium sp. So ce375]|uniref:LysM peptidoglycan-binding domain-containing protein n=1 Tax=Sorangium sp. So ce375 TaxID=3133306 RepID=UPI003F5B5AC8